MSEVRRTHNIVRQFLVGMGLLEGSDRQDDIPSSANHLHPVFLDTLNLTGPTEERPAACLPGKISIPRVLATPRSRATMPHLEGVLCLTPWLTGVGVG